MYMYKNHGAKINVSKKNLSCHPVCWRMVAVLYGQVDGPPLGQLVRGRGDGVATDSVLFRDMKVNPMIYKDRKSRCMVLYLYTYMQI